LKSTSSERSFIEVGDILISIFMLGRDSGAIASRVRSFSAVYFSVGNPGS
jgi:hypothetical protein